MKTKRSFKFLILFCFINFISFAQSISPFLFNSIGTSFQTHYSGMDINIGEPITGPISSGNHQITQGFLQPEVVTLDLKVFIEGFYKPSTGKMRAVLYNNHLSSDSTACDFVTIQLRDPIHMDSIVDSFNAVLHIDGNADFFFPYAIFNKSYFIVFKHRNTIETWSKSPVLFNGSVVNFNFTR